MSGQFVCIDDFADSSPVFPLGWLSAWYRPSWPRPHGLRLSYLNAQGKWAHCIKWLS